MKHLLVALALLFSLNSFAQTNDSTTLPWTAAIPGTSPSKAPTGSLCGSATIGSPVSDPLWTPCQGHNPVWSCPTYYYLVWLGQAANYGWYYPVDFYACARA